jgi:glutamine synthetase
VLVVPELDTLIQLPWKPEVAWVTGDLIMGGEPVEQNPRQILKRVMATADRGSELKTGVECEYFLITPDGTGISDAADQQIKPCYDQQALMRRYDVVAEICDAMVTLGWKPYQNDHEDANGQFEMNWQYDNALRTADKHAFFKYMVKSIAEKHGLRATFMPKPFSNLTGNGCHMHASLWNGSKNVFADVKGELGLSREAYHFIGGVMHSAEALCAITNPVVNSYKRINAPVTLSGATWSPNTVSYTGNNRTHMIRIPMPAGSSFGSPTARPIPICCPRRFWPPVSMACATAATPASGWTSICIPRGIRRPARKNFRSICSTPYGRLKNLPCSRKHSARKR